MHIHILGICGTFMGSLAILAKELGYRVSGSDQNIYPPMSTQLLNNGIQLREGYEPSHLDPMPDMVVIGNAMSRGNPIVEFVLNKGVPYTSGPQWLAEQVLKDRWVLAVSGTHGKTTTTSMLAWVLDQAGLAPGFLIGGVSNGFATSARLGDTAFFVIEADEYDTAFFDKRSKFVHYRPRTLIINNLEFDHADIFKDVEAIQTQFHHLVRTVPNQGEIITPKAVPAIEQTLSRGLWSEHKVFSIKEPADPDATMPLSRKETGAGNIAAQPLSKDGSRFEVFLDGMSAGIVEWCMTGRHNIENGLAALLAARHIGIKPQYAIPYLSEFPGVKRRMEKLAEKGNVRIYDDFAHHPTAIATTLEGLRHRVGTETIYAVIEPRSNTMKLGFHQHTLVDSTRMADRVLWADFESYDWLQEALANAGEAHRRFESAQELERFIESIEGPAHVVLMSNGGFAGLPEKLRQKYA